MLILKLNILNKIKNNLSKGAIAIAIEEKVIETNCEITHNNALI